MSSTPRIKGRRPVNYLRDLLSRHGRPRIDAAAAVVALDVACDELQYLSDRLIEASEAVSA